MSDDHPMLELFKRLDTIQKNLDERLDAIERHVNERLDKLGNKVDDLAEKTERLQTALVELGGTVLGHYASVAADVGTLKRRVDALEGRKGSTPGMPAVGSGNGTGHA